jgi:hypothetical protein
VEGRNTSRFPKDTLPVTFLTFITDGDYDTLNAGRMVKQRIINGLGALNDEGAFSVSSPLISEKFSNARRLRARQRGGR